MKTTFLNAAKGSRLGVMVLCASLSSLQASESSSPVASPGATVVSSNAPAILFETNVYDFGKIIAPGEVSGVFKFKNVGKSVLKVDRPAASCDCTDSKAKPDTLAPGESGEIIYTIKLDHAYRGEKTIRVKSNDPKSPEVLLTMKLDYRPLYEVVPKALKVTVPPGKDQAEGSFTIMRTDGQPLAIEHFTASQKWVTAALEPGRNPLESSAKVNVLVRRPPEPTAVMSSTLQLWAMGQTNKPMQTVMVVGEMQGELMAVPSQLYWVLPDLGREKTNYPPETLTRTIELKSVLGKPVQIKNATSTIKGLSVKVEPKDGNKQFDLVLKWNDLPEDFAKGTVFVETSIATLPKVEVPVTVAVPWGK